jgi:hypothetical protein
VQQLKSYARKGRKGEERPLDTKMAAAAPENKAGKSPEVLLCAAAEYGYEEAVVRLLAKGADATRFDSAGLTPLMHATAGGHAAVAPWNALTPSGLSAGDITSDPSTYDLLLGHARRAAANPPHERPRQCPHRELPRVQGLVQ